MGQPCQNCGRCGGAHAREDWSAAGDAAPVPARPSHADGTSEADDVVAAVVRRVVREALGLPAGVSTGRDRFLGVSAGGGPRAWESEGFELPVGISVRHLHICRADLEVLYGPGARLTKKSDLFEPGEFAANEVVTVVGPKLRTLENVRILGPERDFTQVELSRTDAITIGLDLPMRKSGDLRGAAPITVVGPRGSITLPNGAIRSNRHIHMAPADAARFGVKDNDIVRVRVPGEEGVIYENVQARVKEGWLLTMHVDTDDANASNLFCNMKAYLLPNH